jgi:hypothetical protein
MQLGYSSDIYAALGRGVVRTPTVSAPVSSPASAPSGLVKSNPFDAGKVNILEEGIFETAKSAFTFPASATGAVNKAVSSQASAPVAALSNGGTNFGPNAFPAATQAAFGGAGGSGRGVGYGGFAQGATITIGAPIINLPSAVATAPTGLTGDTSMIVIGGMIMAVVLIVAMVYMRRG